MPSLEAMQVQELPIAISTFEVDGLRLRALAPLRFEVTFDPVDRLFTAEGPFNAICVGDGRAELEAEITAALAFLWSEYVVCSPDDFSADALALREDLLRSFVGVDDADGEAGGGSRPWAQGL